eukprot:364747-Chlamydomonas_euryale.AAC.14
MRRVGHPSKAFFLQHYTTCSLASLWTGSQEDAATWRKTCEHGITSLLLLGDRPGARLNIPSRYIYKLWRTVRSTAIRRVHIPDLPK